MFYTLDLLAKGFELERFETVNNYIIVNYIIRTYKGTDIILKDVGLLNSERRQRFGAPGHI